MTLAELKQLREQHALLLVYFSTPTCSVCKVLRPKVESLVGEYSAWTFAYCDISASTEIQGQETIFAVPTVILYGDRREMKRFSRHFGLADLEDLLTRYQDLLSAP